MRKLMLSLSAATMVATGFAVPADAHRHHNSRYERDYRGYDNRGYDNRGYDNRGYDYRRGDYRYDNGRNYRRCDNGTGGTIIGAIAGGLAGHELAGRRGDRTAGVIIGGAIGALAGRAIDRSDDRC